MLDTTALLDMGRESLELFGLAEGCTVFLSGSDCFLALALKIYSSLPETASLVRLHSAASESASCFGRCLSI